MISIKDTVYLLKVNSSSSLLLYHLYPQLLHCRILMKLFRNNPILHNVGEYKVGLILLILFPPQLGQETLQEGVWYFGCGLLSVSLPQ